MLGWSQPRQSNKLESTVSLTLILSIVRIISVTDITSILSFINIIILCVGTTFRTGNLSGMGPYHCSIVVSNVVTQIWTYRGFRVQLVIYHSCIITDTFTFASESIYHSLLESTQSWTLRGRCRWWRWAMDRPSTRVFHLPSLPP